MAALTAGARVRVVNRRQPMAGCTGEVIGWRGDAFQVELDGLGTHFFEPEELEKATRARGRQNGWVPVGAGSGRSEGIVTSKEPA
jgi:hypothetical protein